MEKGVVVAEKGVVVAKTVETVVAAAWVSLASVAG